MNVNDVKGDGWLARKVREAIYLRQVLWDIYGITGADQDGIHEAPRPGVFTPDVPERALQAVRDLRRDYDEALDEVQP